MNQIRTHRSRKIRGQLSSLPRFSTPTQTPFQPLPILNKSNHRLRSLSVDPPQFSTLISSGSRLIASTNPSLLELKSLQAMISPRVALVRTALNRNAAAAFNGIYDHLMITASQLLQSETPELLQTFFEIILLPELTVPQGTQQDQSTTVTWAQQIVMLRQFFMNSILNRLSVDEITTFCKPQISNTIISQFFTPDPELRFSAFNLASVLMNRVPSLNPVFRKLTISKLIDINDGICGGTGILQLLHFFNLFYTQPMTINEMNTVFLPLINSTYLPEFALTLVPMLKKVAGNIDDGGEMIWDYLLKHWPLGNSKNLKHFIIMVFNLSELLPNESTQEKVLHRVAETISSERSDAAETTLKYFNSSAHKFFNDYAKSHLDFWLVVSAATIHWNESVKTEAQIAFTKYNKSKPYKGRLRKKMMCLSWPVVSQIANIPSSKCV